MPSDDVMAVGAKSETPAPAAEEALVRRFEVTASREEIEREIDRLAEQYGAKVKLPGFRQGRVPLDVVKSTYRKALLDEVIEQLIRKHAFAHIESAKLAIAMTPVAEKIEHADGGDLRAQIAVEVFPEVPLPELDGLVVEIAKAALQEEEYDEAQAIERARQAHERSVPVADRPLAENDLALFSLQTRITESKRLTAKKDSYFLMKPEGASEILDLYPELLGKKPGDQLVFCRRYPESHAKKNWAGREVEHLIQIKSVFELKKPGLDQDFFKSVGAASEEEFKRKLRAEFDHHRQHRRDEVILQHVFDRLTSAVEMPVPASLIQEEIRSRLARQQAPLQFASEEEKNRFREALLAGAKKSVKLSLILDEIRRRNNIEVKDEDVQKEYRHLAEHHQVAERDIRKYYADKQRSEQLAGQLLDAKVLDFVKGKVKIKEV